MGVHAPPPYEVHAPLQEILDLPLLTVKSFNCKSTKIERLPSDINFMCQYEGEWLDSLLVSLPGILENAGHMTSPFYVNVTPVDVFGNVQPKKLMCGQKT